MCSCSGKPSPTSRKAGQDFASDALDGVYPVLLTVLPEPVKFSLVIIEHVNRDALNGFVLDEKGDGLLDSVAFMLSLGNPPGKLVLGVPLDSFSFSP